MKILIHAAVIFAMFISIANAQRLLNVSVSVNGDNKYVPSLVRKGTTFVSARELAKIISANYYYNNEAAKLELKFRNYSLKVTARNQFVVIVSRNDNSQYIYQIPISTMYLKNDVFIPIIYCLQYLNLASEKELTYDADAKHIELTDHTVNTLAFLEGTGKIQLLSTSEIENSQYDVYDINIEEKANGTLVRLKSRKKITAHRSSINNGILYLFLSGVTVDPELESKSEEAGLVKSFKTNNVLGNIQIEFQLKEGFVTSESFQEVNSNDLLITVHDESLTIDPAMVEANKQKWVFDVVVIDAGHGGKDPGAIGITGAYEKTINLGIAKKLGIMIEKNLPGVKVVYTRKDDRFIELYKRGKIANEAGGKLFISIHCNSLGEKPNDVRGFEVYLLRPSRTEEAIDIAEFENSVIKYEDNPERYKQLTDENFILVSMAHSSYMRFSEKFSDLLNTKWQYHSNIPSKGVKQAGFYVLVGASMPGVLVEAGFLSNRQDEAYLKSRKGQEEIARSIYEAVKSYKKYYDEAIKEES
ncbi:N-acetylmuramoyl-L-alanine amidase [Bacteroidota bacterium]